jgi:tRNA pseudouridine55 synthase
MQVPSSVSAIKVNGQRAYKLTRAGAAPELAARPVTIHEFQILGLSGAGDFMDVAVRVRCSSGTYIRALARDLGAALGTGGHLTALRRTDVGPYGLAQTHTLKELEDQGHTERVRVTPGSHAVSAQPPAPSAPDPAAEGWLIPLAEAAAAAFPRLELTADDARRLAQGAKLPLPPDAVPPVPSGDPVAAFDPDGRLVALVTVEAGRIRSLAVFTGVS